MVANVWVAASIFTFSLASMAWCKPSEYRLPSSRLFVRQQFLFYHRLQYILHRFRKGYDFSNCWIEWMYALIWWQSVINSSFTFIRSSGLRFERSSSAMHEPISGIIKKLGSSLLPVINSIPRWVKSTELFFSSITNNNSLSASGIRLLFSCI